MACTCDGCDQELQQRLEEIEALARELYEVGQSIIDVSLRQRAYALLYESASQVERVREG